MAHGQRAVHFHAPDLGQFAVLVQDPNLFQDFVELHLVGEGEDLLVGDAAVVQVHAAVGEARHHRIVRDHHDGAALLVELAQQAQHDLFVLRVEIAGGLVGEDDARIVDERARDAHALLLASGKMRRQMLRAVGQPHPLQRLERFALVGHAVEVLRQHHVLERRQVGDQVELLEDEADLLGAEAVQLGVGERGHVLAFEIDLARGGAVQAADQIHQRGLPRARGTHHRQPLAGLDVQRDIVERADDGPFASARAG